METEQMNEVPKPKRKAAKKPAVRAKPPAAKPDSAFEGITPSDCPMACNADRCVISACNICSHPYKGGLQASLQNPDSLRRLNEAKRVIGKRKLDMRHLDGA